MKNTGLCLALLAALILSGCASIPPQSVELSNALTDQIVDIRAKHIEALNRYFTAVEGQIRHTMLTGYKDDLVAGMRERRKAKGKELTLEEYDQITTVVLQELDSSLKDLESQRLKTLTEVMDRYSLMEAESRALAGLLTSASKVEAMRKSVTGNLEKEAEKRFTMLESVDQKAQEYLKKAQRLKKTAEGLKDAVEGDINGNR